METLACRNIIETTANCLVGAGWNADAAGFVAYLLGVVAVATFPLLLAILLIWFERKVSARVQDRIGPNRIGPFGLLQNFGDALKLIIKEDITPAGADRTIYNAAPIVAVFSTIGVWAVVPFSPVNVGVDLGVGLLYFVAISSIGTLAVVMAGWSSNNKYALLGAFRAVAGLISYEIPMVLALLVPVMLAGTMSLVGIVEAQLGGWFILSAPIAALVFYISNLAETGRAPFDLIEAESELVAGYNIEYSGMKFGLFMVNEFLHAFTANLLFSVIFLGGWAGPFATQVPLLGFVYLMIKTFIVYIPSLILRSTIPRLRIDQMMNFNWKFLVPLSIANLVVTAFLLKVVQLAGLAPSPENATNLLANLPQIVVLLAGNLVLGAVVMTMVRNAGRREREATAATLRARLDARRTTAITPTGGALAGSGD
jgi:NADH-quinone oxidoreductase subunit H